MKILCLGDSLTYGYDVLPGERWTTLVAADGKIQIDNRGQCGDTTAGMVFRLHQLDLVGYDAFFIMGGSNDILLDKDFSAVCRNIETLVSLLKSQEEPVYIGIPPLTKPESAYYGWQDAGDVNRHNEILRRYRQWLLEYSADTGCTAIDFYQALQDGEGTSGKNLYADGVHPNAEGYCRICPRSVEGIFTKYVKSRFPLQFILQS